MPLGGASRVRRSSHHPERASHSLTKHKTFFLFCGARLGPSKSRLGSGSWTWFTNPGSTTRYPRLLESFCSLITSILDFAHDGLTKPNLSEFHPQSCLTEAVGWIRRYLCRHLELEQIRTSIRYFIPVRLQFRREKHHYVDFLYS